MSMISNSENLSNSYEFLNSSLRPKEWNVFVLSYVEIQKNQIRGSFFIVSCAQCSSDVEIQDVGSATMLDRLR